MLLTTIEDAYPHQLYKNLRRNNAETTENNIIIFLYYFFHTKISTTNSIDVTGWSVPFIFGLRNFWFDFDDVAPR